jgi:hypothetical protein
VTVANTGDKDAVNAALTVTADGVNIYTNNTVNVTLGGQTVVTFVYAIPTAEADKIVDFNATITLGTDSAYLVKNITVPGDVDLPAYEITELTVTPVTSQERGLKAKITVKVKNIGDALGDKIKVKFWAGASEIGSTEVVNVTVGGTPNETFYEWAIGGTYALGKVDLNVTIDGTSVWKNISYNIIEYKKPVLTASFAKDKKGKVIGYSSSAAEGKSKTLKIKIDVSNTGTADAKNIKIVIKDSKGKVLTTYNATGTIAPGATQQYVVEIKMKAGASTKITADVSCEGIHNDVQPAVTTPVAASAKVVKTPGFEAVVLAAAVAVALVVLSRRKK